MSVDPFRTGSRREAKGFTLLEMIVALAVFAFAMTFVFSVFLSRSQSFLAQEEIARMQRNLRAGMEFLENGLRSAGYGFPPGVVVRLPPALTGGVPVLLVSGLGVADGGTSASDNLYIAHLSSASTRLGRDMQTPSTDLQVLDSNGWKAGDVGIVFGGGGSDLFQVRSVRGGGLELASAGAFAGGLSRAYPEGSSVARVEISGYFVGTDPAAGRTALFRTGVDPSGSPVPRVVAEDIEDMQVRLRFVDGEERDFGGVSPGSGMLAGVVGARVRLAACGRSSTHEERGGSASRWNRVNVDSLPACEGRIRREMEGYFSFRNRGVGP